MNELLKKKQQLEKELAEINEMIKQEEEKAKKTVKKSDIFFKVGGSYTVFLRTQGTREFTCTGIDLAKSIVKGSYNGAAEKTYKAEPIWNSIADKNENKAPCAFAIVVDKRTKMRCCSNN